MNPAPHDPASPFCPIDEAIEAIRNGEMVVVCDSPDRENEGDLCMAAEFVTANDINFMATHGRGLICLTVSARHVPLPEWSTGRHDGGSGRQPGQMSRRE